MISTSLLRGAPAVTKDALGRRALAQLAVFTDWLTTHNVRGYIGEIGWPYNTADVNHWNMVAHYWFQEADRQQLWVTTWASGRQWGTYQLGQYVDAGGGVIAVARPTTIITEGHATTPSYQRGVNLTGAEFGTNTIVAGGVFSNINPGTEGTDYFYPLASDFTFLANHGVTLVRLPIRWERIQPTLLGALDATELGRLTTTLNNAHAAGIGVIVDLHNFAGYVVGASTADAATYKLSTNAADTLYTAHLVDVWTRLSSALNGMAGLAGYGLMNEPADMVGQAATVGSNLITNSDFETDTAGWLAQSNCSITRNTTPSFVRSGAGSLAAQATGNGTMAAYFFNISISAGTSYQLKGYSKAATSSRTTYIQVDWSGNSGYIASSFGTFPTDSSTIWTTMSSTVTAPSGALHANVGLFVQNVNTGELHYFDDISMFEATGVQTPQQQWEQISQATVTAIRNNSDTSVIFVPGYNYSHVHDWSTNHPTAWITDSAHNCFYEAHHYLDDDHSGAYASSYATEVSNAVTEGF